MIYASTTPCNVSPTGRLNRPDNILAYRAENSGRALPTLDNDCNDCPSTPLEELGLRAYQCLPLQSSGSVDLTDQGTCRSSQRMNPHRPPPSPPGSRSTSERRSSFCEQVSPYQVLASNIRADSCKLTVTTLHSCLNRSLAVKLIPP